MPYDFKKEPPYRAVGRPELVTVPAARYAAVRGQGDPNVPEGPYQQAISALYTVSYALKTSPKRGRPVSGFFDYVVPPLESFWWQEGTGGVENGRKMDFHWVAAIRLPEFVTEADVSWAKEEAARKKGLDCAAVELLTVEEGLCVQMLHIGPFDTEPETVAAMDAFLLETGYEPDFTGGRRHHEIYFSDARRTDPARWRTILRHPVKKMGVE